MTEDAAERVRPIDLLITARWIVPVAPDRLVLENHAVAVDEGAIVEVLPVAQASAKYASRERVDLPEHALIPGLVNAHTHNPMTLLRGLADDLPLMTWLREHIWPVEAKVIGPEFVRDGVELAVAEMLRGGTTCCSEDYFFPDAQAQAYKAHGFRALVALPIIEFPSAWAQTRDEYFERALAVHDLSAPPSAHTRRTPWATNPSRASAHCPTNSIFPCTCT